jgi:hypothetical protein
MFTYSKIIEVFGREESYARGKRGLKNSYTKCFTHQPHTLTHTYIHYLYCEDTVPFDMDVRRR